MEQGRTKIGAHTLAQRERAHRCIQKGIKLQQLARFNQVVSKTLRRDFVNVL